MKKKEQNTPWGLLFILGGILFLIAACQETIPGMVNTPAPATQMEDVEATATTVIDKIWDGINSFSVDTGETYKITEEEKDLLIRITYAESGICSESVQQAVAATILARSKERNMSITDVIFEPGQFTPAKDGQVYVIYTDYSGNRVQELVTSEMAEPSRTAVEKAIAFGAGWSVTSRLGGEPLYFYAPKGCSDEELKARANIQDKIQLEELVFYRIWNQ